jgi:hypothetical protein
MAIPIRRKPNMTRTIHVYKLSAFEASQADTSWDYMHECTRGAGWYFDVSLDGFPVRELEGPFPSESEARKRIAFDYREG